MEGVQYIESLGGAHLNNAHSAADCPKVFGSESVCETQACSVVSKSLSIQGINNVWVTANTTEPTKMPIIAISLFQVRASLVWRNPVTGPSRSIAK